MYEREERLPDWAWNDNELEAMAKDVIESNRFAEENTHIVFYNLWKDGKDTGLVMLLAVRSVIDGKEAIDRLWKEAGIIAAVGEVSDESLLSKQKIDAMYLLFQKYRYIGKLKLPGHNKVFQYQEFMGKLI